MAEGPISVPHAKIKQGGIRRMSRWTYKATQHNLAAMPLDSERIIECDDKGHCLVHDLHERSLHGLKEVVDEEGEKGWELVQCNYHGGELLCIWKKEEEEA